MDAYPAIEDHGLTSSAMNLDYPLGHGAGWVEPVLTHGFGGSVADAASR